MNKAFLFCAGLMGALLAGGPALAAGNLEIKYEELPKLVRDQNQNAASARALIESAEIRTHHLGRSFLPTLRLDAGYEAFKTGVYAQAEQPYGDLEARLNLYRGGRDRLEEGARRAEAASVSAMATKTHRQELFKARNAFWDLVHAREVAATLKEFIEQNERHIAAATRRAARGLTTETDQLGFQLIDLQLREELESQNHEMVLIQAELAPLLGASGEATFQTVESIDHEHRDDLLEASASGETTPDMLSAQARRQVADFQKKSSLSLWKPTVDVYGGAYLYTLREREYLDRRNRDDIAVGVKASLYLFEGLQAKNQADSLSRQAKAYQLQADYLETKLQSDLFILKGELRHLDDLVHSSEEQIELGRKVLSRTTEEYNRGVKNAPDVTSALGTTLHLRRQYAERRRDYKRAEAKLFDLLGL